MNMKDRILTGFRDLSVLAGFHGATMDELSFRTGISKRTIYRYFKSKDELVNAVADDFMAQTEQHVNTVLASEGNPVEKIGILISTMFQQLKFLNPLIMRDIQKYYPHIWSRIEAFRARKIRSVIENMLLAESRQGYFRETIPAVFMTAILSSIRDVVNPAFILENGLTVEKTAKTVFEIFMYGIVADEARKNSSPLGCGNPETRSQESE